MSALNSAKELLAPANLLSLARIPLAVWIAITLRSHSVQSSRAAFLLLFIAGLTDLFDGMLARYAENKTGRTNRFGVALDPVADKLLAILLIGALVVYREFPLWLAGIVFIRDFAILIVGWVLIRAKHIALPSNLPGKYYFATLAFLLASYVAGFQAGVTLLMPLTVALWALSSAYYLRVLLRVVREEERPAQVGSKLSRNLRIIAVVSVCLTIVILFAVENPLALW